MLLDWNAETPGPIPARAVTACIQTTNTLHGGRDYVSPQDARPPASPRVVLVCLADNHDALLVIHYDGAASQRQRKVSIKPRYI